MPPPRRRRARAVAVSRWWRGAPGAIARVLGLRRTGCRATRPLETSSERIARPENDLAWCRGLTTGELRGRSGPHRCGALSRGLTVVVIRYRDPPGCAPARPGIAIASSAGPRPCVTIPGPTCRVASHPPQEGTSWHASSMNSPRSGSQLARGDARPMADWASRFKNRTWPAVGRCERVAQLSLAPKPTAAGYVAPAFTRARRCRRNGSDGS